MQTRRRKQARAASQPTSGMATTRRSTRARASRPAGDAAGYCANWKQMPLELLLLTLTKLDTELDLRRACCVSKVWLAACTRDSFWRPLCQKTWPRNKVDVPCGGWSAYYLKRRLFVQGTEGLPAGLREKELSTIPYSLVQQHLQAAAPLQTGDDDIVWNHLAQHTAAAVSAAAAAVTAATAASAVTAVSLVPPAQGAAQPMADPADIPDQFNKIFACAWPEDRLLLAGTKDNKLVRWKFDRNFTVTDRKVIEMADLKPLGEPAGGIHCISFNKQFGGAELACGGNNPDTIMVMDYDTMQPRMQLVGNEDWMFSCCWTNRHRILSGSRDCTVRIWSTEADSASNSSEANEPFECRQPLLTRREHTDKIRDMKYNLYTKQVTTMSTDGIVKIWDASNLDVVSSMMAPESQDLVSMAIDDMGTDSLVLGSRRHLTFIDPRSPGGDMRTVVVPNAETGVRSLSFREHLVTIGCGGSHLLFYDTRMPNPHFPHRHSGFLHAGPGWIRQDDNFHFMFPEDNNDAPAGGPDAPRNAIYTHAYDASGKVLFTGGGPLQVGLFGESCDPFLFLRCSISCALVCVVFSSSVLLAHRLF